MSFIMAAKAKEISLNKEPPRAGNGTSSTGISCQIRTKLRDWVNMHTLASAWAALSLTDLKIRYAFGRMLKIASAQVVSVQPTL